MQLVEVLLLFPYVDGGMEKLLSFVRVGVTRFVVAVLSVGEGTAGSSVAASVLEYCSPVPVGAHAVALYLNMGGWSVLEDGHPTLLVVEILAMSTAIIVSAHRRVPGSVRCDCSVACGFFAARIWIFGIFTAAGIFSAKYAAMLAESVAGEHEAAGVFSVCDCAVASSLVSARVEVLAVDSAIDVLAAEGAALSSGSFAGKHRAAGWSCDISRDVVRSSQAVFLGVHICSTRPPPTAMPSTAALLPECRPTN